MALRVDIYHFSVGEISFDVQDAFGRGYHDQSSRSSRRFNIILTVYAILKDVNHQFVVGNFVILEACPVIAVVLLYPHVKITWL